MESDWEGRIQLTQVDAPLQDIPFDNLIIECMYMSRAPPPRRAVQPQQHNSCSAW